MYDNMGEDFVKVVDNPSTITPEVFISIKKLLVGGDFHCSFCPCFRTWTFVFDYLLCGFYHLLVCQFVFLVDLIYSYVISSH